MNQDIRKLWNLIDPYVSDAGFELVEVQSGRETTGWVVRIFIDRPERPANVNDAADALLGQTTVSLEDCERVSRDISAALDVADIIPHAYALEVSSPGLDRPLRRERDFARFAGQKARVRLVEGLGGDGRRNFSGVLRGARDGLFMIDCDGRSYELSIEDVAKANLVPDWELEFKRRAS